MRLKIFAVLVPVTAMMAFSAPAFAIDNPAAQVYGGDVGQVLDETVSSTPDDVVPPAGQVEDEVATTPSQPGNVVEESVPATPVTTGSLPFTGFESGLVALLGAALLGTGFVLRRTSRRTDS